MPLGGNNFFFHIILHFKQNIPLLYNHQSALKQETQIQSTICDFLSHLSSPYKQRCLKRKPYLPLHEKRVTATITFFPLQAWFIPSYTHVIAMYHNKNVNWTNGRKRCFNMFAEIQKAQNVSAQGIYVKIQIEDFV